MPSGSSFCSFVETAAYRGILSGYSCGGPGEACDGQQRPHFRPAPGATSGQIAKIVYGAVGNPRRPVPFPQRRRLLASARSLLQNRTP